MEMIFLLSLSNRKTIHIHIDLYYKTELMTRDNDERAFLVSNGIALLVKPFILNALSFIDSVMC